MITFETLKTAQRQERKTNSLTELSQDFFQQARKYLQSKQEFIEKLALNKRDPHIHELELKNAQVILIDIYERRERKLLQLSLASARASATQANLLEHEKRLLNELISILDKERDEILAKTLKKTGIENIKKDKSEMKRVKFTHDFPSFLGIDEKEYGPFAIGDIVELPRVNAEILIGKSMAHDATEDSK